MDKLLYRELSYKLRGLFFQIRNSYGPGQKENVYQNLLVDALKENNINFEKEKPKLTRNSFGGFKFLTQQFIKNFIRSLPHQNLSRPTI
jgi:hypothetical protein